MNKYKNKAYNILFPSEDQKLREALSEMQDNNAYFLVNEDGEEKYIAHVGFENIKDLDEYIKTIQNEISYYEQRWNGTATQQGLNERLEELLNKINIKNKIYKDFPENLVEPEFKSILEEYKELLKLQKEELEKYNTLKLKLEELLEFKKVWLAKIKEDNNDVFKHLQKIKVQLENARKELEDLKYSDYPEHYKVLREKELKDLITYLEKRLPRKMIEKPVEVSEITNEEQPVIPHQVKTESVPMNPTKTETITETTKKENDKKPVYYTAEELKKIFREMHEPKNKGIKNIIVRKDSLEKFRGISRINDQKETSTFANIGNVLYAASDVGMLRENNEDSYAICTHPKYGDFTLSLVADGMGGVNNGEIASNYVANELLKWFQNLSLDLYYNPQELRIALNKKIKEIDVSIPAGGTTLACIITCENEAIVTTIGDSRVYAVTNAGLKQIGHDHSIANLRGLNNEESRFYLENNVITKALGIERLSACQTIIPRTEYISLHAMTDGITDVISEKKLEQILTSDLSAEEKQHKIINLANSLINKDLINLKYLFKKGFSSRIGFGKDNETLVSDYSGLSLRR